MLGCLNLTPIKAISFWRPERSLTGNMKLTSGLSTTVWVKRPQWGGFDMGCFLGPLLTVWRWRMV